MPVHRIMDITGHTEKVFDGANKVDVAEAMQRFATLTGQGYVAAKTVAPGQHEKVTAFNPADDLIFQPHMVGG